MARNYFFLKIIYPCYLSVWAYKLFDFLPTTLIEIAVYNYLSKGCHIQLFRERLSYTAFSGIKGCHIQLFRQRLSYTAVFFGKGCHIPLFRDRRLSFTAVSREVVIYGCFERGWHKQLFQERLSYTAVSGKVVLNSTKAYATIPKDSMGRSEESLHVLNDPKQYRLTIVIPKQG